MSEIFGGIEAGGTKFYCAVGTGPGDLLAETQFATTSPAETIDRAIAFFKEQRVRLNSIGIGSFGPLELNPDSPEFGYITTTPKPGWSNTNFSGRIEDALGMPVVIDTDVNAAALGEYRWGAAQGLDTFVYVTIGTGIGGSGMINGKLMHGLSHPEMGHMRIPHDRDADPYPGACPYHGDCLEGLASGQAIELRWGRQPDTLPVNHPAWALEARYLALGVVNIIVILSPQRIILGGGVMSQPNLLTAVQKHVQEFLNNYIQAHSLSEGIEQYIVRPQLGKRSGVLGAIALASRHNR